MPCREHRESGTEWEVRTAWTGGYSHEHKLHYAVGTILSTDSKTDL